MGTIRCQVDPERGIPQSASVSDERTPTFPVSSSEIFDDQGSTNPTSRRTLSPEVREVDGCIERHTEESEVREAYVPLSLRPLIWQCVHPTAEYRLSSDRPTLPTTSSQPTLRRVPLPFPQTNTVRSNLPLRSPRLRCEHELVRFPQTDFR